MTTINYSKREDLNASPDARAKAEAAPMAKAVFADEPDAALRGALSKHIGFDVGPGVSVGLGDAYRSSGLTGAAFARRLGVKGIAKACRDALDEPDAIIRRIVEYALYCNDCVNGDEKQRETEFMSARVSKRLSCIFQMLKLYAPPLRGQWRKTYDELHRVSPELLEWRDMELEDALSKLAGFDVGPGVCGALEAAYKSSGLTSAAFAKSVGVKGIARACKDRLDEREDLVRRFRNFALYVNNCLHGNEDPDEAERLKVGLYNLLDIVFGVLCLDSLSMCLRDPHRTIEDEILRQVPVRSPSRATFSGADEEPDEEASRPAPLRASKQETFSTPLESLLACMSA
jgi:hypothetical protein